MEGAYAMHVMDHCMTLQWSVDLQILQTNSIKQIMVLQNSWLLYKTTVLIEPFLGQKNLIPIFIADLV